MTQPAEMFRCGKKALIALGSNTPSHHGTPRETLEKAMVALDGEGLLMVTRSRLFRTPFFPPGGGPDVVNAVALVQTELAPAALIARLHEIEVAFGRERRTRWADRTLDLDLLAMGDCVLPDEDTLRAWIGLDPEAQRKEAPEQLILPHPRIQDRAFVLVPAADVAPEWRHPLLGLTIAEMRDARPEAELAEIVPLDGEANGAAD